MFHEHEAGQAADRSPQQIQTEITDPYVLFAVDGAGRRGPAVIGFFKQGEKVDLASIEPGTAALPFALSRRYRLERDAGFAKPGDQVASRLDPPQRHRTAGAIRLSDPVDPLRKPQTPHPGEGL